MTGDTWVVGLSPSSGDPRSTDALFVGLALVEVQVASETGDPYDARLLARAIEILGIWLDRARTYESNLPRGVTCDRDEISRRDLRASLVVLLDGLQRNLDHARRLCPEKS